MPKGIPNKRYTGEFRQEVVEPMQRDKLSHQEVARLYGITAHDRVARWERIYLEEGPEGLYIACRSRGSKGAPTKETKIRSRSGWYPTSRSAPPMWKSKMVGADVIISISELGG